MSHQSPRGYITPATNAELQDFAFWASVGLNQDARWLEISEAAEDAAQAVIDGADLDPDWKGSLPAETSMDTVVTPGRYGTVGGSELGWGMLIVSTAGSVVLQDAITSAGHIRHRSRSSQGWTDWRRLDAGLSDTIPAATNIDTLTSPSNWVQASTGVTTALGYPEDGFRGHIFVRGSVGYNVQTAVSVDNPGRWERTRIGTSSPWGPWTKTITSADLSGALTVTRAVTSAQDPLVFSELGTGVYQVTRTTDGTALGLPTIDHGILMVQRWTSGNGQPGMATWTTKPTTLGDTEQWTTEIAADGTAVGWRLATGSGRDQSGTGGPDMGLRHVYVSTRHAATIGGPIDVGTATPVALTWDDYPGSFKAHGLAALAAQYEIPMTLAIPSRALDPGNEHLIGDQSAGVTWTDIDGWVQDGWIELANHSATHRSTITDAELEDEIVTALAELQAHSPTKPIRTWVMPDNSWPGLDEGRTADGWASRAGSLILGHHAFATGKHSIRSDHAVPMTGIPFQGANRRWIEAEGLTDTIRQNLVASSYGTNRGVILGAHPAWIGQGTRWTLAQVETFLAWLAAERDAGRVRPMFLSEWAWAKSAN